ncbi:MAG: sigma-70 family RNA polymerase sigma factor [Chloroflexi bacterium]|nr:sigma-70 family RNA polymerase sigma factor [Chloroflexota bacterium]MBE3119101.1 sigma-70 family RNA polymerase sigma factor [Candidatus Atribacteria bacterium]
MQIRATLRLRNNAMIAARQRFGLTQSDLAKLAECSITSIQYLESLDWRRSCCGIIAERIAGVLDLGVDDVVPPGGEGIAIVANQVRVAEIEVGALLTMTERQEQLEYDAIDQIQAEDVHAALRNALTAVTERERTILELHYGMNGETPLTLKDIGMRLGITCERVCQIEARALRKLAFGVHGERLLAAWTGQPVPVASLPLLEDSETHSGPRERKDEG